MNRIRIIGSSDDLALSVRRTFQMSFNDANATLAEFLDKPTHKNYCEFLSSESSLDFETGLEYNTFTFKVMPEYLDEFDRWVANMFYVSRMLPVFEKLLRSSKELLEKEINIDGIYSLDRDLQVPVFVTIIIRDQNGFEIDNVFNDDLINHILDLQEVINIRQFLEKIKEENFKQYELSEPTFIKRSYPVLIKGRFPSRAVSLTVEYTAIGEEVDD